MLRELSVSQHRFESDIYNLVDRTLQICELAKTAAPASWAVNRLSTVGHTSPDNFIALLDAVLRLAREFPSCMHIAAAFIINHQSLCRSGSNKQRITAWLKSTMKASAHHGNDFEQAWCLVLSGVLRIQLDESDFRVGECSNWSGLGDIGDVARREAFECTIEPVEVAIRPQQVRCSGIQLATILRSGSPRLDDRQSLDK